MLTTLLIALLWLAVGIFNWGFFIYASNTRFPEQAYVKRHSTYALATLLLVVGPLGLPGMILIYFMSGRSFGWCVGTLSREESLAAFRRTYPVLDPYDTTLPFYFEREN